MKVVICGGGIMGCSTAYHLAKKGVKSTVVERCAIACGASGKAGGFLAKDWCEGSSVERLAQTSFEMHAELAKTFPNCDYRELDTLSITVKEGKAPMKRTNKIPAWVDGSVTESATIGTVKTTAQVHPKKLTEAMMEGATELAGSEVKIGVVVGVDLSPDKKKVTGVQLEGGVTLEADVVVIAMGPWSGQARKWLNTPSISGLRAHSIILKPEETVTPHALFVEYVPEKTSAGGDLTPEFYPRPDGTVYVCGMADQSELPVDPGTVAAKEDSIQMLRHMTKSVSKALAGASVETEQACFLPVPPGDVPLIGKVPNIEGAYIASGHTCWGILNAPGTGAALAELIVDGSASVVNLAPFNPARF